MKCKRHPLEQGPGVCVSCLRDRLLALQAKLNGTSPENHRRNPPPPVLVPRAESPSHRRSADSDASDPDRRGRPIYTPQSIDRRSERERLHGCRRFPLISSLFHHHHRRSDESVASSSWFSLLIHRWRRKKTTKTRPVSSPPMRNTKSFVISDRGMSPVRGEETDDNVSEAGYSTESSAARRRPTPTRKVVAEERHRRHGGTFAGITLCLSPLARPGHTSRRSRPSDLEFSGDLRNNGVSAPTRHVSGSGGSFGPNRSRKLADHGRFR